MPVPWCARVRGKAQNLPPTGRACRATGCAPPTWMRSALGLRGQRPSNGPCVDVLWVRNGGCPVLRHRWRAATNSLPIARVCSLFETVAGEGWGTDDAMSVRHTASLRAAVIEAARKSRALPVPRHEQGVYQVGFLR